jgi:Tat protein translocase TatB subunit
MNLFGVGASEALVVLVLALIVVGPQRFPEIARQCGRWFKLARGYTDEVMKDVETVTKDTATDAKATVNSAEQAANETPAATSTESTAARESSLRPSKRGDDT